MEGENGARVDVPQGDEGGIWAILTGIEIEVVPRVGIVSCRAGEAATFSVRTVAADAQAVTWTGTTTITFIQWLVTDGPAHGVDHGNEIWTRSVGRAHCRGFVGRCGPVSTSSEIDGIDRILDAAGAAGLLHVSTKTVLRLARAGELPGRKVGREWRFETYALLDHVAGRKTA